MSAAFDFYFFPNRHKIENQFSFILAILLMLSNFPTITDLFFSQISSSLVLLLLQCECAFVLIWLIL